MRTSTAPGPSRRAISTAAGFVSTTSTRDRATPQDRSYSAQEHTENLTRLGHTILSVPTKVGLCRLGRIDAAWQRAYAAPFPDAAACRGALQFPRNLLLPETWAYLREGEGLPGAMEALSAKPALLIHGAEDATVPAMAAEFMFRALWPQAPMVVVPGASHYVTEDAPEVALASIQQFVQQYP